MVKFNASTVSGWRLFLFTLVSFIFFLLVGSGVTFGLMLAGGIDPLQLDPETFTATQRNWLRLSLLANNLLLFAGSAVAGLVLCYRRDWLAAAGLDRWSDNGRIGYAAAFFLLSLPVVAYVAYLNLQVPLPDWAMANEEQTNLLLGGVLTMPTLPEFLLALLTVAVTPAIGEELLLRGVLQRRILGDLLKSHHAAIWLAATIFSAMHFEFGGFLPRLILGVALGYAYHWSKSLWVPVLLHFFFNGAQVAFAYFTGEFTPDTEMAEVPSWWLALAAAIFCGYLLWLAEQRFEDDDEAQEEAHAQVQ